MPLPSDLLGADFRLSPDKLVLLLTEADYAGGARQYRNRVAALYAARRKHRDQASAAAAAVVCHRTATTLKDFLAVQEFVVIELGLPLLPISGLVQ